MNQQCTASVLASYATLKSLSDDKKYQGPYQMLREFIRYIRVKVRKIIKRFRILK